MKFIDLTGKKFNKLSVLKREINIKYKYPMWLCKCDCGNKKMVSSHNLLRNHTKSCGCLLKKNKGIIKHKHAKKGKVSRTYITWQSMNSRCNNPNNTIYKYYGKHGIKVCKRWSNKNPKGFQNFLEDMGERPKGQSIDRVNNDGNYNPKNCKWSTSKEQCRNRRSNHLITFKNKTLCLSEWAEEYNISYKTLKQRIKNKWPIKKALKTPIRKCERK